MAPKSLAQACNRPSFALTTLLVGIPLSAVCLGWIAWSDPSQNSGDDSAAQVAHVQLFDRYAPAYLAARSQRTRLVVIFADRSPGVAGGDATAGKSGEGQESALVAPQPLTKELSALGVPMQPVPVVACLPPEAKVRSGGREIQVLAHPAFAELRGGPGVAVVDFTGGKDGVVVLVRPRTSLPTVFDRVLSLLLRPRMVVVTPREAAPLPPATIPPQPRPTETPPPLPTFRSYVPPVCNLRPLPRPIQWFDTYEPAYQKAKSEARPLLIYFRQGDSCRACSAFDEVLSRPEVENFLRYYVCVRLPLDSEAEVKGRRVRLLSHPSFAEMLGQPGVAIVDLAHKGQEYYDTVVSTFPFLNGRPYTTEQTLIILTLPPGTLTQRTLIYAVRSHPERPRSADGVFDPLLAAEAASHASYQARIGVQGHHFWETRFHRILSRLPLGLVPQEVCAESWPGQNLLESAIECVRCWRLSSGHWSAVSRYHPYFGYDMKRGANGVWYATGIFARR